MNSLIYVTTKDETEAQSIASALLQEKLIACGNILPGMKSIYEWQGEVRQDQECVLILKTTVEAWPRVEKRVKELHSYDCPCMIRLKLDPGHQPFYDWVQSQVD